MGEKFQYRGAVDFLLVSMIEKVSGKPYEAFIEKAAGAASKDGPFQGASQ